jgi:hypothetical protein
MYYEWCRERDSNPHEHSPLPPQDSVSTSSTTSALKEELIIMSKYSFFASILKIDLLIEIQFLSFINACNI